MKTTEQNRTSTNDWCIAKNVLSEGELNGSVTLLGPGGETPADQSAVERLLFVAQGPVTAITDLANTILNTDQAFHVPEGRSLVIRNHGEGPARVFTLALPAKRREEPLVVFPR